MKAVCAKFLALDSGLSWNFKGLKRHTGAYLHHRAYEGAYTSVFAAAVSSYGTANRRDFAEQNGQARQGNVVPITATIAMAQ